METKMRQLDPFTYDYRVREVRGVIDGDTFDLLLDRGFFDYVVIRVRLKDIDTYEVYGPHASEAGQAAREFAEKWLHDDSRILRCRTFPDPDSDSPVPDGAFGRWLGDVYDTISGEHLNDALREAGHEEA